MGLDQNIYRIKKPNIDNRVYTTEEISAMGLSKSSVTEFENCVNLLGQLTPYIVKRDVECKFYDVDKMIADYNLPKDSYIWKYGFGGINICGKTENGERIDKAISDNELQEKYIKMETLPHYIWKEEEVQYWRKNYELQDWIYEHINTADNTAYCLLNTYLINELNATFGEDIPVEEPTDESALFYWEWY